MTNDIVKFLDNSVVGKFDFPQTFSEFVEEVDEIHASVVISRALYILKKVNFTRTVSTKDRSQVSGTGKKMYKQKGTGNARHSSAKAPQFVGGGVAFGPGDTVNGSFKINKKEKLLALRLVFALLSKNAKLKICDFSDISSLEVKTSSVAKQLDTTKKTLIISVPANYRRFSNIKNVNFDSSTALNLEWLANSNQVILDKDIIQTLIERLKF